MKKLIALTACVVAAAAAVPAFAATRTVRVDDDVFRADAISIRKNDTVRFRWVGDALHNVIRTSGPSFKSISSRRSGTVPRKFTRRGRYTLVCSIHPGMDMRIRVR